MLADRNRIIKGKNISQVLKLQVKVGFYRRLYEGCIEGENWKYLNIKMN